jgi:hypothetical protein
MMADFPELLAQLKMEEQRFAMEKEEYGLRM